jgi:hypothetical protein
MAISYTGFLLGEPSACSSPCGGFTIGGFDAFRIALSDNRYPMATHWVDLKLNGSGGPQKRAELEAKHFIPQQIKRFEVCVYHTQNGRVLSTGNTRGGA